MSHLLDTNVISEWTKPQPNPNVVRWLEEMDEDRLFLSVISLAEIRHGIERLDGGAKKARLDGWLEDELMPRFEDRLLDVDRHIAKTWGILMARAQRAGHTLSAMDVFMAATAEYHGLTLVTRNSRDFQHLGLSLLDIWREGDDA